MEGRTMSQPEYHLIIQAEGDNPLPPNVRLRYALRTLKSRYGLEAILVSPIPPDEAEPHKQCGCTICTRELKEKE